MADGMIRIYGDDAETIVLVECTFDPNEPHPRDGDFPLLSGRVLATGVARRYRVFDLFGTSIGGGTVGVYGSGADMELARSARMLSCGAGDVTVTFWGRRPARYGGSDEP